MDVDSNQNVGIGGNGQDKSIISPNNFGQLPIVIYIDNTGTQKWGVSIFNQMTGQDFQGDNFGRPTNIYEIAINTHGTKIACLAADNGYNNMNIVTLSYYDGSILSVHSNIEYTSQYVQFKWVSQAMSILFNSNDQIFLTFTSQGNQWTMLLIDQTVNFQSPLFYKTSQYQGIVWAVTYGATQNSFYVCGQLYNSDSNWYEALAYVSNNQIQYIYGTQNNYEWVWQNLDYYKPSTGASILFLVENGGNSANYQTNFFRLLLNTNENTVPAMTSPPQMVFVQSQMNINSMLAYSSWEVAAYIADTQNYKVPLILTINFQTNKYITYQFSGINCKKMNCMGGKILSLVDTPFSVSGFFVGYGSQPNSFGNFFTFGGQNYGWVMNMAVSSTCASNIGISGSLSGSNSFTPGYYSRGQINPPFTDLSQLAWAYPNNFNPVNNQYFSFSLYYNLVMSQPCSGFFPSTVTLSASTLQDQYYYLGSSTSSYKFPAFTVNPSTCTDTQLQYYAQYKNGTLFPQGGIVSFNGPTQTFSFYTLSDSDVGSHQIQISAFLPNHQSSINATFTLFVKMKCYPKVFPIFYGLNNGNTVFNTLYVDIHGNIGMAGYSQDPSMIVYANGDTTPIIVYMNSGGGVYFTRQINNIQLASNQNNEIFNMVIDPTATKMVVVVNNQKQWYFVLALTSGNLLASAQDSTPTNVALSYYMLAVDSNDYLYTGLTTAYYNGGEYAVDYKKTPILLNQSPTEIQLTGTTLQMIYSQTFDSTYKYLMLGGFLTDYSQYGQFPQYLLINTQTMIPVWGIGGAYTGSESVNNLIISAIGYAAGTPYNLFVGVGDKAFNNLNNLRFDYFTVDSNMNMINSQSFWYYDSTVNDQIKVQDLKVSSTTLQYAIFYNPTTSTNTYISLNYTNSLIYFSTIPMPETMNANTFILDAFITGANAAYLVGYTYNFPNCQFSATLSKSQGFVSTFQETLMRAWTVRNPYIINSQMDKYILYPQYWNNQTLTAPADYSFVIPPNAFTNLTSFTILNSFNNSSPSQSCRAIQASSLTPAVSTSNNYIPPQYNIGQGMMNYSQATYSLTGNASQFCYDVIWPGTYSARLQSTTSMPPYASYDYNSNTIVFLSSNISDTYNYNWIEVDFILGNSTAITNLYKALRVNCTPNVPVAGIGLQNLTVGTPITFTPPAFTVASGCPSPNYTANCNGTNLTYSYGGMSMTFIPSSRLFSISSSNYSSNQNGMYYQCYLIATTYNGISSANAFGITVSNPCVNSATAVISTLANQTYVISSTGTPTYTFTPWSITAQCGTFVYTAYANGISLPFNFPISGQLAFRSSIQTFSFPTAVTNPALNGLQLQVTVNGYANGFTENQTFYIYFSSASSKNSDCDYLVAGWATFADVSNTRQIIVQNALPTGHFTNAYIMVWDFWVKIDPNIVAPNMYLNLLLVENSNQWLSANWYKTTSGQLQYSLKDSQYQTAGNFSGQGLGVITSTTPNQWEHVLIGFQGNTQNSGFIYLNQVSNSLNNLFVTVGAYPFGSSQISINLLNHAQDQTDGAQNYIKWGEVKGWIVPSATFTQDWVNRYSGLSFKYTPVASIPSTAYVYFVTQPYKTGNSWPSLSTPTNNAQIAAVSNGFYFNWNTDCNGAQNLCAMGYAYTGNNTCQQCFSTCTECAVNTTNCYACAPSYVLSGNTCTCQAGQYQNVATCINCTAPCANCTGNGTNCLSCIADYGLVGINSCVACTTTQFKNSSGQCSSCNNGTTANCKSCITSPTTCTSCMPGFGYLNTSNTCVGCNSSQYLRMPDQTCQACDNSNVSNCQTCVGNYSNCTSCISNKFGLLNNTCISIPTWCPNGQYIDLIQYQCSNCIAPCSQCLNTTACTFCASPYNYIDDGSYMCTNSSCPPTTFQDPTTRVCRKCPQNCLTCNPTTFACTTCATRFLLTGTTCTQSSEQCPQGYFYNSVSIPPACAQCSIGCENCISSSTCKKCLPNYFLNLATQNCAASCTAAISTYEDVVSGTCQICQTNCLSCTTNNSTCTACKPGFYLYNNSCVARCPILGFYQNSVTHTCDACSPACQFCINSITDCIKCSYGAVMQNRVCSSGCAAQYYQDPSFQCYPCDPSCQVCDGPINSQCSQCISTYFLYETTCSQTCPDSMFGNPATGMCQSCAYYCSLCNPTQCLQCDPGYKVIPNDCQGNYFLRTSATFSLSMPLQTAYLATLTSFTQITFEIWFKADSISQTLTQVVVGISPYKIRIKGNGASNIQIFYNNNIDYCDTAILISDTWYHFAFSVNSVSQVLACYLDGVPQSIGSNPTIIITQTVNKPTEITFGGSKNSIVGEQNFIGLMTEFRMWNVERTPFLIASFMKNSFTAIPTTLISYWKLNEKNDGSITYWTDSAQGGALTYSPLLALPSYSLASVTDMREIYLLLCPDGQYANFNYNLGYYVCQTCNLGCKQCLNSTIENCTDCYSPKKLLQESYTCSVINGCPTGFYEDPISGLCLPCFYACMTCINSANNCPICNSGFFRQYQGSSCVATCPNGMYGNYATQSCFFNPTVTEIGPADGAIFIYGDVIDLTSEYQLNYNENPSTFTIGWVVIRVEGQINISNDVVKKYYNTSLTRVHLDLNVLQPNYAYQFTFFLQGVPQYYNNFYTNMTAQLYVGTNPRPGTCQSNLLLGYATISTFTFEANSWEDPLNITEFNFYYSMDGGNIYIPIATLDPTSNQVSLIFNSVYENTNVKIKCEVIDSIGFTNSLQTTISVLMVSTASAQSDLAQINVANSQTEASVLTSQLQLNLIAQQIGNLNENDQLIFDPKITLSQCVSSLCNYKGDCHYISMHMKYVCGCQKGIGGINCTFSNSTMLSQLQNYTQELSITYITIQGRQFDLQYIKLASEYVDLMTDQTFGQVSSILNQLVTDWDGIQTSDVVQDHLNILSSLIEYLYNQLNNNRTFGGVSGAQYNSTLDNIDYCMAIFNLIKQNAIQSLSQYNTQVQYTSKMIAFRQVLTNQQAIQFVSATNLTSKNEMTYVKVSVVNFQNSTVYMDQEFVIDASEYVLNPFIRSYTAGTAANVFEVHFYNSTNLDVSVPISNLSNPFQIFYLGSQNLNISSFQSTYTALSPYKNDEKVKRIQMLNGSELNCSYWNTTNNTWAKDGCSLSSIDQYHLICQCNHLTSFSSQFQTPPVEQSDIVSIANSYNTTTADNTGEINLVDLKLPFNGTFEDYVNNIAELLQHKQTPLSEFFFRPGLYFVLVFWFFFTTSQVYYSGRDRQRRYAMPKNQNRNDLAEIHDDEVQCLNDVIKNLIIRDWALEQAQFDEKQVEEDKPITTREKQFTTRQTPKHNQEFLENSQQRLMLGPRIDYKFPTESPSAMREQDTTGLKINPMPIYEEMTPVQQKSLRQRARRKVFGRVAGLCERSKRFYKKTFKRDRTTSKTKMVFFYEELKNNYWFGLLSKTSKIAPRHARLTVMYFNVSLQLTVSTIIYMLGWQSFLFQGSSTFQNIFVSLIATQGTWILSIPVALIFRMPLSIRRQIEGVKTKKINEVFQELDNQMGCRYAIGYFFCLCMYCLMSVIVLFFSYVYPKDYCMDWLSMLVLLNFLDLLLFTFGIAGLQLLNALISLKMKCWVHVWATIEVFRYIKNMRG